MPNFGSGNFSKVFGRVALVGDAAFILRPHTAASKSKAAANALALADALIKHHHDVSKALEAWEPTQLAYGLQLLKHGQMLSDHSQFSYGNGCGENTTSGVDLPLVQAAFRAALGAQ
jgi:2-polyprenyl-6-methoxyphenol hydroxylase-like FAD-dependent oxidoreductase